jgi:UDP-N-acetylmuramoylalanine--D-glutamate ligase
MSSAITILGAGESGLGAARLAAALGLPCRVSDAGMVGSEVGEMLAGLGVELEQGGHDLARIQSCELLIKSPGIPGAAPAVRAALDAGCEVIGEIEFAARHTDAVLVAITGTNGKTTTTALLEHLLTVGGVDAYAAGNIGQSFAGALATEPQRAVYVLEVSSFQLEDCTQFKPHIAIVTGLSPDHLDRHGDFDSYADAKWRITQNQGADDHLILPENDPQIERMLEKTGTRARVHRINALASISEGQTGAGLASNDTTQFTFSQLPPFTMSIQELALQGKHNLFNSMAAGVAARVLEVSDLDLREGFKHFKSIEHRLEHVAEVNGITFINDSKATNVNAAWYALDSLSTAVIWIVGGVDKGNDYSSLQELVGEKVHTIVCLGKDNAKIKKAFAGCVSRIVEVDTAEQAAAYGYRVGAPGDTVLLAPACASFDLFSSYEERGSRFKSAVRAL